VTTTEEFFLNYGGPSFVFGTANVATNASLKNISGDNILGGNIILTSDTARIDSDANNLIIAAGIGGGIGANDLVAFGGAGDFFFAPGSTIGGGLEWVYKDGTGILNLAGSTGNSYSGGTVILDGTVVINEGADLGTGGVFTFGNSTLMVEPGAGAVSLSGRDYVLVGGVTSNINITAPDSLAIDLARVSSSAGPNVLRTNGTGTLSLVVNNGDAPFAPIPPGTSIAESALLAPTALTFGGGEAAILDPASGLVVIDNSANADRVAVTVAGLGNTVAPGNSLGTLALINTNLLIDGVVPTFFGGSIVGDGALGIAVDTELVAASPGFTGQTVVHNNATLTLSNAGALGAALDYDQTGTYVDAGSTLALNDLGGAPLAEGVTLFNNARLINNTGNNILTSMLLVEHDLNANPNATVAHVGAIDGVLTLAGGIEDHNTGGDMSLSLNTEAGENGILLIGGPIGASIRNVTIGETASTGAVVLGTANLYGGNTTLRGGTVLAADNNSFSNGLVTVAGPVTLSAAGTQLANNFVVNGGSTLTTMGLFEINGKISGFGGVTVANDVLVLNGENTYSGPTVVNGGGILLVGNSLSSTQITVDAAGLLGTTQSNVLSDAAQLTVNGQFSLGGNEEIRSISGLGLIDTNIYSLGVKEGSFDGDIIGLGDLNKTTNGILTLNNPVGLLGTVNVLDGTLNLGGLGGLATTEINVSNGAFFNTGGADQLNDLTTLLANGTVSLGGNETIQTLNGTGIVDINTFALTVSGGTFNGSINNHHGDLNKVGPGTLFLGGANGYVGGTHIQMGTIELSGTLASSFVEVDALATLDLVGNQRIIDTSALTINGTLNLGGNETVASVTATGTIGGAGVLTAGTYALDGATVNANLGTGALSSAGSTTLNGNSNANTTTVTGGTTTLNGSSSLVTNGSVGNINPGTITVNQYGTWNVNGSYAYDLLRGIGTVDPGGANGNTFRNDWEISPGYSIGTLTINGDYEEDGTYHAELAGSPSSDTIRVNGYAALDNNSVLRLTAINGLDSGNVLCGERWNIIDSYGVIADYNGNFDRTGWNEITDVDNAGPNGVTFSSQVLFDRGSGDVVALGLGAGETIADYDGIDSHHLAILGAVLDGATDGIGNYNSQDGGAGTVLDAIYTSGSYPGDKDSFLEALDALSPEGYAGTVDYALHATRSYAQNVMAATPQMAGRDWELVAGWSHFGLQADSSHHSHDYDLNSNGGYLGLRVNCHPDLVFGGFIAADNGSIDSGRIDLDADGFILGGFVEWTPQGEDGPWNVWGNLAYGSYEFDGHRRGLINRLSVSSFDADAFQLGVGVDYEVYEQNGLRVVPGIGLRYIDASTDGFTESGGADALHVGGLNEDQLLLDLALRLYYQEAGQPYAFHGEIGWQHDFSDASRDVSAILANGGGVPFSVEAPGLGEDAFTFGLGAIYDLGERYRIGLSYRGEVRSDSDMFNGLDLRVTTGF